MTSSSATVPTRYWHELDDGRLQCDVCPRACKLRPGQRGVCFVRARDTIDGADGVVLTTYGRSSGFCVDPIEKKPLNHFLPGSSTFSFGTAGCNLACRFCQNWDISKSKEIDTLADAASPERSPTPRSSWAVAASRSPTTTRRSSSSTRRRRGRLPRRGASAPSR
jgi:pyruvate formate lyase activating enzyme